MAERQVSFTPTSGPYANQTISGTLNDGNPFTQQQSTAMVLANQPQAGTFTVILPSGQRLDNLTQAQVTQLQNEAALMQQQQNNVVDLRRGKSSGVGIVRTGVDAMGAVTAIMQRSDIQEHQALLLSRIKRVNAAIKALEISGTVDSVAVAALKALRDCQIDSVVAMDETYTRLLYEALGHGAAVADDFGLFNGLTSGNGGGVGMGALALGGGLLLGGAFSNRSTSDLASRLRDLE